MEIRRMDDLVGPNGEPVSPAHKLIYDHISECKVEIIEDHGRFSAEEIAAHVELHHHTPLTELASSMGKSPGELMIEFIDSIALGNRVVDALEGPEEARLDGTLYRRTEEGVLFKIDDILENQRNGIKHKAELTKTQWAFAGTTVTALTAIAVALIAAA